MAEQAAPKTADRGRVGRRAILGAAVTTLAAGVVSLPTAASAAISGTMNYRGAWAPQTSYKTYDVVTYNGALYVANVSYVSGSTFDPSKWTELATDVSMDPATDATDFPAVYNVRRYGAKGDGSTNDSSAVQAAIDAAFNGGGGVVWFPKGVWCGSFQMRPDVDLEGCGWQSMLQALPGQTVPVLDYSGHNAYHTEVRNLRIDGNYKDNRTDGVTQGACRGINMDTNPAAQTMWLFNNSGVAASTPTIADDAVQSWYPGTWNDSANRLHHILVTGCGGDWAVYFGYNQRNTWFTDSFIYLSKNGAFANFATDTMVSNLQAGACGDGILIGCSNQKYVNCKSWYHGVNAGYNSGPGDGWRVSHPRNNTLGPTQLVGCESQDNNRYGLAVTVGDAVVARGFVSGGDSGAALYLQNAQNCDIDCYIGSADRTNDTKGLVLDGSGGAQPQGNVVKVRAIDRSQFTPSNFTAVTLTNGAYQNGNKLILPNGQHGLAWVGGVTTGTYAPADAETFFNGAFTGPVTIDNPAWFPGEAQPGQEMLVVIQDTSAGGNAVTWGSAYHGVSGFTTTAKGVTAYRFTYLGWGYWMTTGGVTNAA